MSEHQSLTINQPETTKIQKYICRIAPTDELLKKTPKQQESNEEEEKKVEPSQKNKPCNNRKLKEWLILTSHSSV